MKTIEQPTTAELDKILGPGVSHEGFRVWFNENLKGKLIIEHEDVREVYSDYCSPATSDYYQEQKTSGMKYKALLIKSSIEPIEADSFEKLAKDFTEKCQEIEYRPNRFTALDLSNLYYRAKKLLEGK